MEVEGVFVHTSRVRHLDASRTLEAISWEKQQLRILAR